MNMNELAAICIAANGMLFAWWISHIIREHFMKKKPKGDPAQAAIAPHLSREQHIQRHKELHACLDELIADWITCTRSLPSCETVMTLMSWSARQMQNPEVPGSGGKHED